MKNDKIYSEIELIEAGILKNDSDIKKLTIYESVTLYPLSGHPGRCSILMQDGSEFILLISYNELRQLILQDILRYVWNETYKCNFMFKLESFVFSKKGLLGELARWSIRQSPYYIPDNLEIVLRKASDLIPSFEDDDGYRRMGRKEFYEWFFNIITQIPELVKWNSPKNGSNPEYVFISRYDKPDPDADIIDLSALVNNIGRELFRESLD